VFQDQSRLLSELCRSLIPMQPQRIHPMKPDLSYRRAGQRFELVEPSHSSLIMVRRHTECPEVVYSRLGKDTDSIARTEARSSCFLFVRGHTSKGFPNFTIKMVNHYNAAG